jgi:WD40 repeat protein
MFHTLRPVIPDTVMNERPRFGRVWNFFAVSFVVVLVACTTVQVGLTPGDVMLAFAPDGSMVATAPTGDNTILLLESRTLAERAKLSGKSVTGKAATSVHSLEFSRDGTRLLAAGIDDTLIVWDVATRTELFRRVGLNGVRQAAFSPDGMLVAIAGPGFNASLWRIEGQQQVAQLKGHFADVTAIAFSHDGNLIATGSADRTVRLWPLAQLEPVTLPEWHSSTITGLTFSKDDALLAASAGNLTLWRVADRRSIAHALESAPTPQASSGVNALATLLMIVASARSMHLGGGPIGAPPIDGHATAGGYAADLMTEFSPDGRLLAVLKRAPSSWGTSEVVIAEIAGSKVQRFACECSVIAFRPDGRAIATAGKDGIRLWNPETATPLPVSQ